MCRRLPLRELEKTKGRTVSLWAASGEIMSSILDIKWQLGSILRHTAWLLLKKENNNKKTFFLTGHTSLGRFEVFFYYKRLGNFLCHRLKCERQPLLCVSTTKLSAVGILSALGSTWHLVRASLLSNLHPAVLFPYISMYMITFLRMLNHCVVERIIS